MSKKGKSKDKKKPESKVLQTCFTCTDNRINCITTCSTRDNCKGCPICGTTPKEPCIHCEIDCKYDKSCFIRGEWAANVEKGKIPKNDSSFDMSNKTCQECPYDYFCVYFGNNMCPEDMSDEELIGLGYSKEIQSLQDNHSIVQNTPATSYPAKYSIKYKSDNDDVWDTHIECISECPHKSEMKIKLSVNVVLKLGHLQREFPHHEFTVYANTIVKEKEHILEDIIIPKQKVSYASVSDIETNGNYNTIIHKHPGDNPGGFSGIDNEFANSNHDYSILIGSKGLDKVLGTARIKTDCGKFMRIPLKLEVMLPSVTDEKFLSEVNNIEKSVFTTTYKNDEYIQKWANGRRYFY